MSRKTKRPTNGRRPAAAKGRRPAKSCRGSSSATKRRTKGHASASRVAAQRSVLAARYLWATVTALVIAALLFEPTMVWTLGVGIFMVASAEFSGLWLVVTGYGLACLPAAFGLLIATGRFWSSLTHALWIGALYAVLGFVFLDQIIGALTALGW